MNFKFTKSIKIVLFLSLLVLGFLVRLYKFDAPIADWHSWRQADTSAVSRNFVTNGFDLLHPKFDDLSNVPSGIYDNPQGYRFVEFPIYNIFQAGFYILFGQFTIEQWGRLVSIFFSLLSAVFLFLLVKKRAGDLTAFMASFFFLLLPFNIFYGRTILPDPAMISFILAGIYFFDVWLNDKTKLPKYLYFALSTFFWALAFLIKPFSVFFTLPMIYLAYEKFGLNIFKKISLWALAVLSVTPFILWRVWMSQYPEGIPQSSWLFNSNNIRFKGAFFNWIFANRIGEFILGYWGIAILIVGFLASKSKNYFYFLTFALSSLIYLFTVATGNVQHSYYQIPIIPSIAIFLGLGASFLINPPKEFSSRIVTIPIFLICTLFLFAFSWFNVRDYYNIYNPSIIKAGEAVDNLIPKDAKIIANYEGDTSFLYQTKRKGWASFEKSLPEMIKMGADYLVLANPTATDLGLGKTYKIVSQTRDYAIFDLNAKP